MLMHRQTMRDEARKREAEDRRIKRFEELERLPNGEVIWPDGQPLRPTRDELADAGYEESGGLW
jgi:hypothetical protein